MRLLVGALEITRYPKCQAPAEAGTQLPPLLAQKSVQDWPDLCLGAWTSGLPPSLDSGTPMV